MTAIATERSSKIVHGFCAKCGSSKEPNANYVDDCKTPGPRFGFCANCGKPKDLNRNYVHEACLCR